LLFYINQPTNTDIYTLSLHDALPICWAEFGDIYHRLRKGRTLDIQKNMPHRLSCNSKKHDLVIIEIQTGSKVEESDIIRLSDDRSEEHTSELQSRSDLVCRLLLEKKK